MSKGSDLVWVRVNAEGRKVTDNAFLCGPLGDQIWLPFSQCNAFCVSTEADKRPSDTNERPIEGVFVDAVCIPRWLAARNHLEIDE